MSKESRSSENNEYVYREKESKVNIFFVNGFFFFASLLVLPLSSYSKLEMILNSTQKLYAISLTANCVNCVVFVHKLVRLYLKYKL